MAAATEHTALLAPPSQRRPANSHRQVSPTRPLSSSSAASSSVPGASERKPLSVWQLSSLTMLLAGIQFVWTVELGYGTPYLLSLGLSKPLMTLVWMAGPLSGLLIQPIVGRLSDRCASRMGRRRPYIIGGAAFVVTSVIMIAYAREMGIGLAHLLGLSGANGDGGVPGSDFQAFVTRTSIVIAVAGFYILDFSINTSQACARALALDIPPLEQQDLANAYAGRMLNLGSVTGYMVGFMDLRALLPWQTDSQMQALCLVATAVFTLTITWTCVCVREVPLATNADCLAGASECGQVPCRPSDDAGSRSEWADMIGGIVRGVTRLPTPVQRVCNVQLFAWMAWFPFLFFATTWVTEVMARTGDISDPDFVERATRAGSFALFLYSIASLGFSVLLPAFVEDESDSGSLHNGRSRFKVSLRSMWRISLGAMSVILLMTYFAADVKGATILIIAMAFPWSLAMWAPFALVGEYVAISAESPAKNQDALTESNAALDSEISFADSGKGSAATAAVKMPAGNAVADEDENEDYIVGSQSTATAMAGGAAPSSSWRRPHELLGSVGYRASLRGDSIASTIQCGDDDDDSAASTPPQLSSQQSARLPLFLKGTPRRPTAGSSRLSRVESAAVAFAHDNLLEFSEDNEEQPE
ncbi:hypothetical protein GGF46_005443, partial [Coemansia sp. RSA 552]